MIDAGKGASELTPTPILARERSAKTHFREFYHGLGPMCGDRGPAPVLVGSAIVGQVSRLLRVLTTSLSQLCLTVFFAKPLVPRHAGFDRSNWLSMGA